MEHLKNDQNRLKDFVRDTMDIYAQNFNKKDGTSKNLKGENLVYYAKLEENRYYKGTDEAVIKKQAKQGDPLPGDNTHVHIIVSRKDKTKEIKLSPLVNSKKLFSRENFKMKSCNHFDENYRYKGSGKELEKHLIMRDGTIEQRIAYITKQYEEQKATLHKTETQSQEQKPELKQEPKQKPDNEQGYGMGM